MQKITLPWGAWYGDVLKTFLIPNDWRVKKYSLDNSSQLSEISLLKKMRK